VQVLSANLDKNKKGRKVELPHKTLTTYGEHQKDTRINIRKN